MMKSLKNLGLLIKKDPSYFIVVFITFSLLFLLLANNSSVVVVQKDSSKATVFAHKANNKGSQELTEIILALSDKKQNNALFDYLRPIIRQQNQKFMFDRAFLKNITKALHTESQHNNANLRKLKRLAKTYDVKLESPVQMLAALDLKVDIIPEALILALAFIEAKTQNKNDKSVNQRFFISYMSAVSYIRHFNSHDDYQFLRQMRAELRERNTNITAIKLASGLVYNSSTGERYIKELIELIQQNNLE